MAMAISGGYNTENFGVYDQLPNLVNVIRTEPYILFCHI